ncbi:hypothetical protein [Halalkalicoccus tibetensis]|uniref:DUF4129 domain-containing protein n=1 Tax=Halalkalicoccus tibetensis TaxID=175632 RepID=A0ABD5V632_9EURY
MVVLAVCLSLLAVSGFAPIGEVTAQDEEDNETDAPHTNPDEASEEGDGDRVSDWLQDRLSDSLGDSNEQVSEGQYDQAREILGDDYDDYLEQYGEVSDEGGADEYEESRDNQTELIDAAEEYDATYEEYEEAREAGNDQRARELARELDSLADEIDEEGQAVNESQETIEEETGTDTSETREAVDDIRSDTQSTQQEIRDVEFIPTEITVETDSETASFDDPMTIDGTITTTDGAPVTNEQITLEIGDQTVQTTTDLTGSFTVEYRPTIESLEQTELEIDYTPEAQSEYGGDGTTIPVTIEQSEADVEITETTESVAFGEELSISGTVGANGVGAQNVPVAIFADGDRLGQVITDEDGTFEGTTELPANIRAGDIELRALASLNEQALTGSETTTSIEVTETPSTSDVAAEHTDESIYVEGLLATEDGTPIAGELVTLEFGGESVTVETEEDGSYETLVAVPDGAGPFVTVDAIYADDGSNIGDSSASTEVQVGEETLLIQISEFLGISWLATALSPINANYWLALAGLLLLSATGAYFLIGQRGNSTDSSAAGPSGSNSGASSTSSQESVALRMTLLESARELARTGDTDQAVERAYIAVRQDESGEGRADTHWEFYRNRQEGGFASEQINALRELTQRFERAAFSTFNVSQNDAEDAIEDAETLIDDS